jgi:hypothetical protein
VHGPCTPPRPASPATAAATHGHADGPRPCQRAVHDQARRRGAHAGAVLAACGGEGGSSEVGGKGKDLPGDTTGAATPRPPAAESGPRRPRGPPGPWPTSRQRDGAHHGAGVPPHRLPEGEFVRTLANFRKDLRRAVQSAATARDHAAGARAQHRHPGRHHARRLHLRRRTRAAVLLPAGRLHRPNTMWGVDAVKKQPAWSGGGVWCSSPAAHPSILRRDLDKATPRAQRDATSARQMDVFVATTTRSATHAFHARLDSKDNACMTGHRDRRGQHQGYLRHYDIVTFALRWDVAAERAAAGRALPQRQELQNECVLEVPAAPTSALGRSGTRARWTLHRGPGARAQLRLLGKDPPNRYNVGRRSRTVSYPPAVPAANLDLRLAGRPQTPLSSPTRSRCAPAAPRPQSGPNEQRRGEYSPASPSSRPLSPPPFPPGCEPVGSEPHCLPGSSACAAAWAVASELSRQRQAQTPPSRNSFPTSRQRNPSPLQTAFPVLSSRGIDALFAQRPPPCRPPIDISMRATCDTAGYPRFVASGSTATVTPPGNLSHLTPPKHKRGPRITRVPLSTIKKTMPYCATSRLAPTEPRPADVAAPCGATARLEEVLAPRASIDSRPARYPRLKSRIPFPRRSRAEGASAPKTKEGRPRR